MALPAVAGLSWLATLLIGAFTSLFSFLTQFVSKRLAIVLLVIAAITTLTTAFFVAISGLISGMSYAMPSFVALGLGHVWPTNATACLSAIATGHVLRFAYEWNIRASRMKAL
ncbi:MAG: DUF5455 family protein [Candidatus Bathyarchaeia archaeon]